MKGKTLNELRKKMIGCYNTQFRKYGEGRIRCPSIKQMAKYIEEKHPELEVRIRGTSAYKYTKASGMQYSTGGGSKEYVGNILTIYKDRKEIFEHDSTETYRTNSEVADFIISKIEKDSMYNYDDKGKKKND